MQDFSHWGAKKYPRPLNLLAPFKIKRTQVKGKSKGRKKVNDKFNSYIQLEKAINTYTCENLINFNQFSQFLPFVT